MTLALENLSLILDGIVLSIIFACGYGGYKKGLFMTFIGVIPMIAGVIGVSVLSPFVASALLKTPVYWLFLQGLENTFSVLDNITLLDNQVVVDFVDELIMPEFLKESLFVNNNPVVHEMLGVDTLGGYIAGFLSNVCVNLLSAIITFLAVSIGVNIFIRGLNFVSKLPVLNMVNQLSGIILGLFKAFIIISILGVVMFLFQCNGQFLEFTIAIEDSSIANFFYKTNFLIQLLINIFGF